MAAGAAAGVERVVAAGFARAGRQRAPANGRERLALAGRGQHHQNLQRHQLPWDLAQFGGVARHVSHWALGVLDGGSGRCFPAGGMHRRIRLLGGAFRTAPQGADGRRWWLAGALRRGLYGAAQLGARAHLDRARPRFGQGWLCWTGGWLCELTTAAHRLHCTLLNPYGPRHAGRRLLGICERSLALFQALPDAGHLACSGEPRLPGSVGGTVARLRGRCPEKQHRAAGQLRAAQLPACSCRQVQPMGSPQVMGTTSPFCTMLRLLRWRFGLVQRGVTVRAGVHEQGAHVAVHRHLALRRHQG